MIDLIASHPFISTVIVGIGLPVCLMTFCLCKSAGRADKIMGSMFRAKEEDRHN